MAMWLGSTDTEPLGFFLCCRFESYSCHVREKTKCLQTTMWFLLEIPSTHFLDWLCLSDKGCKTTVKQVAQDYSSEWTPDMARSNMASLYEGSALHTDLSFFALWIIRNIMRITWRCTLISLSAIVSQNRLNPIMQRAKIDRSVRRALPVDNEYGLFQQWRAGNSEVNSPPNFELVRFSVCSGYLQVS